MKLTNAQIGKSGELLVQYKLLKYGITVLTCVCWSI